MAIRIGILGASKIAPLAVIAPTKANPGAVAVAIAARDPARAHAFAAQHDVPRVHETYAQLIAGPDIDLVYNGLPPKHHMEWTLAALKAGKHVLLEKPSGMNAAEAQIMAAAAEASGRRVIEAFHYRYHPLFDRVLHIVRAKLGTLQSAEALFEVPIAKTPGEIRYDAGLGGGALMDLGCYPVHWLRMIAGAEPDIASARQRFDPDGADIATEAALSFPGGLTAKLSCSMQPDSCRPMAMLKVTGSKGMVEVLNPLAPQFGHLLQWRRNGGELFQETFPQTPTYDYQMAAVMRAITTGERLPTEGGDMIANMWAIDAIRTAAQR